MSGPAEQTDPSARAAAASAAAADNFHRRLREAQIALVYSQAGPTLIGAIAALLFYFYVLFGTVPAGLLTVWLSVSTVVYLLRYLLVVAYRRADAGRRAARPWDIWFLIGALLSGLLWGLAGVVLLPEESIAHQAFLVVGVTGVGAGAAVSYAALRGVPQAFIVPALVPFGLHLATGGDELQQMMGFVVLMFMAVLLISALTMHQSIDRSLRLGLENEVLVQTLSEAKDRAEAFNRELRAEIDERRHAEQRIRASRQELARILENMQDMYFRTDLQGRVVQVSPSVRDLLGYAPDEVTGVDIADVFADKVDLARFMQLLDEAGGKMRSFEARMRRKGGGEIWVSKNAQYYRDESGAIAGIEGTSHDITRLKRAQADLDAEKERALVTLAAIADGVISTNAEGLIDYINPVAEALTGVEATRALGRPLAEVFRVVDEDTRQLADDPVRQCLRSRRVHRIPGHPILLSAGDRAEYSIEARVAPIFDEQAQITGTALVFHDVTELRGLAREMSYQAAHDMLTGLVNRREFELRAESAIQIARREGLVHALCYLDVDQFKVVNDTCGHIAGDELIKQLASRLQGRIRESDTLARLGGDEFGVLLEACPQSKAVEIAEELRELIRSHRYEWEGHRFDLSVSIGVVAITKDSGSLAEVLSAADSACYVAKDQGRNRVHVFDTEDSALLEHHSHMRWVPRLQSALDADRFELHCQRVAPIGRGVDAGTSDAPKVDYHEILVRLREDDQLIAPGMFIAAAERYHLMPAIDRWVVRRALQMLAGRTHWGAHDLFAINLSGHTLSDEDFLDFVVAELEQAGIEPRRLCFEITETAAVANLRSAQHFIHTLRRHGCAFALDDFGSGLSSFAYLKRLPVDYLKIDGRFVKDIVSDTMDHAMVEAINQLGHIVGVRTIAEFVENAEILA
ncbi:MAG: EAL domain-containing protein, partial [Thauera sp.]|nr:EAL domain-containing protein [Thauera sp.]